MCAAAAMASLYLASVRSIGLLTWLRKPKKALAISSVGSGGGSRPGRLPRMRSSSHDVDDAVVAR